MLAQVFMSRCYELIKYIFCNTGESPTYALNEDTQPVIRAIGVSHTACKDEVRQYLRSHSWSVFLFL